MRSTRVYFSRAKQEIETRFQGWALVSLGIPTGRVGASLCFESISVRNQNGDTFDLSERDFSGPVTVKIWQAGRSPVFAGIADDSTVSNLELLQTA